VGEDQSLLRHGSGVAGHVKLFMQDINTCSKFSSFLIELVVVSDLPSQPPIVLVADVMLQVHEVAAGPDEEGVEPGEEWFDGVFLTMPIRVSWCIQINNVRGLIRALLFMEPGDSSIFQLLDPLHWLEDPIAEGNVEVGHSPVILNVPVRGTFKYVFIVFNVVVEPADLLVEVVDFAGLLSITSGDGYEEPLCDGSEDIGIEVRVGHQSGRNSTGRHRWFRALDQTNWERDAVFSR
jgi:hypothetical protein